MGQTTKRPKLKMLDLFKLGTTAARCQPDQLRLSQPQHVAVWPLRLTYLLGQEPREKPHA